MSDLNHDFDRPTVEILLDLIYESNQYRAPSDKISFGLPQPLDLYPDITSDENTFVPVKVDETFDDRFDGKNGFLYRRLSMSILVPDDSVTIDAPVYPFHMADILAGINAKFHTQLSIDDIVNEEITAAPDKFVLKANPHSLVWLDSVEFVLGGTATLTPQLTEDGSVRITEDGQVIVMETA